MSLLDEVVEAYRNPGLQGYQYGRQLKQDDRITIEAFPDIDLLVDDVFLLSN